MKKKFVAASVALALMLITLTSVSAQGGGGSWTSFPYVSNMGDSDATVVLEFYDTDGDLAYGPVSLSDPIPPGASVPLDIRPYFSSGTFYGSMVISADQPIASTSGQVNLASGGQNAAFTYEGISSDDAGLRVVVPSVHRQNGGYLSDISVQSTQDQAAEFEVEFIDVNGTSWGTLTGQQAPGFATEHVATQDVSFLQSGNFNGGAVISVTNGIPVAVVANEYPESNPYYINTGYTGMTSGSTSMFYCPSIHNQPRHSGSQAYKGWRSYVKVQSLEQTDPVTFTLSFYRQGVSAPRVVLTDTLGAGETRDYGTLSYTDAGTGYNGSLGDNFVGSAVIESISGGELAVVVSEVRNDNRQAAIYSGFPSGSTTVLLPAQHNEDGGWRTYNKIQNISSTDAEVQITYYDGKVAGSPVRATANFTVTANSSLDVGNYMFETTSFPTGFSGSGSLGSSFRGSAKVEVLTPGAEVVVVASELVIGAPVDALVMYNGIAK